MKWSHITACAAILTLTACTAPPIQDRPTAIHTEQPQPEPPAQLEQKIDKLVTQLADEKYAIREAADEELRKLLLQDTENFNTILSCLKRHLDTTADPEVRMRLERMKIEEYIKLGISSSLLQKFPNMLSQLTSPDWQARRRIVEELAELGGAAAARMIVKLIDDPESIIRRAVIAVLNKMGEPAVKPLVRKLGESASMEIDHQLIGMQIAEILIKIGKPAVTPLIEMLDHADRDARAIAAWALGEIGDQRAVEPLIAAAQNEKPGARAAAAEALGKIGDRKAIEPLIGVLLKSDSFRVRELAAFALAKFKGVRAQPLIKALQDPSHRVRRAAARALGSTKDTVAVEPLVKALSDTDSIVRQEAARALIKIDMPIDVRWRKALEKVVKLVGGQIVQVDSKHLKIVPMPKVTIKVHDADLRVVLDQIATLSGVNIVIAPDVKGKVSVNLRNVPWRTAFDTVVKTLGYVVVEEGDNVLRVVRPKE